MEARLVNRQTGETIVINKPVFRIGREKPYVDYFVADPTVSRIHCEILRKEDGWYLRDCNSANGTSLIGITLKPNEQMRLAYGDAVWLSGTLLYFEEVR